MALSDSPPALTKRGGCGIARLDLTDAERAILDAWLADDRYSARRISERLAEDDYQVSYQIVSRHRAGTCGCDR